MSILDTDSLIATLDNFSDALADGGTIARGERVAVGRWIALRLGAPGGYRGLPAPTEADLAGGAKLYTGEAMNSWAGLACKMGFEAARVLVLLNLPGKAADLAREQTIERVDIMLREHLQMGYRPGAFCCSSCSAALWRLMAQCANRQAAGVLSAGMKHLRSRRDGAGRWRSFPFWYTTLALSEMDAPAARTELRYAAPVLEKALRRRGDGSVYARRRIALARRVLAEV